MLELKLLRVLKSVLGSKICSRDWFSGIKIHKHEISMLRYLIFFVFLPRTRSEQLFTIYLPPLIIFIAQRTLVFLIPCMETLVKSLVILVIVIWNICAVLFEMEREPELYTAPKMWKSNALIHCTIVLILINTLT